MYNVDIGHTDYAWPEEVLPFHCISDGELIDIFGPESSPHINLYIKEVKFDILNGDRYLGRIAMGNGEGEVLCDADTRNSVRCQFCEPSDVPVVSKQPTSILHLNIRSIAPHFEELEVLIHTLHYPPIIGISETWLKPENENLYAPIGYNIYANSR